MPSTKCSNCGRKGELFSGVKNNAYYTNLCEGCVGVLGSAELSRQHERQYQRRHYAKDIIQPTETGYAKVYGADAARAHGWSEADLRKYG